MNRKKKETTFEEAFRRLNEIVESLEAEETPLEDSLLLYEEGIELSRFCAEKLRAANGRLQELRKKSDGMFELIDRELA